MSTIKTQSDAPRRELRKGKPDIRIDALLGMDNGAVKAGTLEYGLFDEFAVACVSVADPAHKGRLACDRRRVGPGMADDNGGHDECPFGKVQQLMTFGRIQPTLRESDPAASQSQGRSP